eukprot:SAG11_NODE_2614_length_3170_cov_2.584500_4_plen_114_part_00
MDRSEKFVMHHQEELQGRDIAEGAGTKADRKMDLQEFVAAITRVAHAMYTTLPSLAEQTADFIDRFIMQAHVFTDNDEVQIWPATAVRNPSCIPLFLEFVQMSEIHVVWWQQP